MSPIGKKRADEGLQTVQNLCVSKDTMSLKTVCSALSRRMTNMDVVMQYTTPSSLLLPMCTLLNEWTHDEDQSKEEEHDSATYTHR